MDNQVIIITTESELQRVISRAVSSLNPEPKDNLQDRITPRQAMAPDLLDCSWPTFRKMANEGIIKLYGEPRRYYLFRSEVIDAIRSMSFTPKTEKP